MKIKITKDEYWIRFGDPKQSSSFTGNLEGKYLFFCFKQKTLINLIKDEITNHGFKVGKVSIYSRNDYVACLYWFSDERKWELLERYKNRPEIVYRFWKSNNQTRREYNSNKPYYDEPIWGDLSDIGGFSGV